MRSAAKLLGKAGVWCLVACVLLVIIAPATGWYFAGHVPEMEWLFNFSCIALTLLAIWGAFGSRTLLVRVVGSLVLASLVLVNVSFSAAPIRNLAVVDGAALLGCFWLLPFVAFLVLRSLPAVGWQIGIKSDNEVRVARHPLRTGGLIASTLFIAVTLFAYRKAFPGSGVGGEAWVDGGRFSIEEGLAMGIVMTLFALLLIWSGLNYRNWVFVIFFGGFCSLASFTAHGAVTDDDFNSDVIPFLSVVAAMMIVPICFRLAGFRLISKRRASAERLHVDPDDSGGEFARYSALSLPVVAVVIAWLLAANLNGALQKHRLHCMGEFDYQDGVCVAARIPVGAGETVLDSRHFRRLQSVDFSDANESLVERAVDAAVKHENLRELGLAYVPISEELFLRLVREKDWERLKVRFSASLAKALRLQQTHNHVVSGKVEELSLWVVSTEERVALTADAIDQVCSSVDVEWLDIVLESNFLLPPSYTFAEIANLFVEHPNTSISVPLENGRAIHCNGRLELMVMSLLDERLAETLAIVKPHTLLAYRCRTEFMLSDDEWFLTDAESEPAEPTAEQVQLSERLKQETTHFRSIVVDQNSMNESFLEHFVTADDVELKLHSCFRLQPEEARMIAAKKNIAVLILSCDILPPESIDELKAATHLKHVYYDDHLAHETAESLRKELSGVKVSPLSERPE